MTYASRISPLIQTVNAFPVKLLIVFTFLFVPLLIQTSPAQITNSSYHEIESVLYKHGEVIVRVNFDNEDQARNFGIGLEPMQSDYSKGYLVFHLTQEEYSSLISALATTGMTIELDQALTRQYITHFQPRVPEPSPAPDASPGPQTRMTTSPYDVSNYPTIPGFSCYRTVEGTMQTAQDIANNSDLATWTDVGDSWEKENQQGPGPGYDLMVLKLTNSAISGPKPKVFITSVIHAREYTTAELMTRFAAQLVEGYGNDADITWVLDHHEIHLMLVANPDGRKQAETGILWRKNTNQNYCGSTSNNRGADLNRNFSYEWNCCGGSSSNQCGATYHGSGPASEPETQAVINYIQTQFSDSRGPNVNDPAPLDTMGLYIDVHSSGRLILWPWGFTSTPAPNGTQLQTLGRKLAFFNGHEPQQSIGLYPTDGTTTSFAYGEMGLPAYTYELGTQFFESCSYFENTLLPDNLPSLAYAIKTARQAYVLPAGPDVINQALTPMSPTGVPAGTQVTLTMTATDQRFNNTNGTEPSHTVESARYYLDIPPWDASNPPGVAMSLVDGNPDSQVEAFTATIDTTGFSENPHIIYIQAEDSSSLGVVSAIFLDIDNNAVLPVTVFSDDFETFDPSMPWITGLPGDTATTGQWEQANPEGTNSGGAQQLGTTVSGVFDLVTGPLAGTSVGTHDIDNGTTSISSPDIILPVSSSISLSFYSYMAHLSNATPDDFFRASISDGVTSTVVFEELGSGNQDNAVWEQQIIDITAFSGQTINIEFSAADAAGGSLVEAAVDDVVITAVQSNQPPDVTNPGNQSNVENTFATLQIVATDDDPPLVYSATGLPDGLSINSSNGLIDGTLTAIPQDYNTSVTVTDSEDNDTTVDFIWTITDNQPPDVTNPGHQTYEEASPVNLPIMASDPENDPLTFSANLPAGLSINSTSGLISGTLTATQGDYPSSVTVSDDQGNDTIVGFTWTVTVVNDPPQVTNPGNQSSDEDTTILPLAIDADDPDGDQLFYTARFLPPGLTIDQNTGVITGSLDFNSAGTYNTEVDVTDNIAVSTVAFNWTVTNVNRPPTVTNPGSQSSDEDTSILPLAIDADDPDGDQLFYTARFLPPGLTIDQNTGVISGSLDFNSAGTYNSEVDVTDNIADITVAFTWTVADVNQAPTVNHPGNQSDEAGTTIMPLQIVADDLDNDTLTYTDSTGSLPAGLSINSGSGVISGTLTAAAGSYPVIIEVSDGMNQDLTSFTWTVTQAGGSQPVIYLSSTTGGSVGGVSFSDEDILRLDRATDTWEKYLDGSDVGLSGSNARDINAFTIMDDGSVIFSVIAATSLPDVGSVDDSDLIRFVPTQLGEATAGSFEFYFDGSDVGLTANGEDIDSVYVLDNGDILISTIGGHSVPGVSGADEDLLRFTPTSLGTATSGSWSRYFDGSDVGLSSSSTEDVYGAWLDESSGDIYLSTRSTFSVSGVSGTGADIFVCENPTTGTNTSCSFSLFWSGSEFGYGSENIDGLFIK